MNGGSDQHRVWRRAAGSVALIVLVTGLAATAWTGPDGVRGTHAKLFESSTVDLRVTGPSGVDGFLTKSNLAPGDRVNGTLVLYNGQATSGDVLDLDVDFQPAAPAARSALLQLFQLRYGADDLLSGSDAGRDLVAEIDGDPLLGDGDGILTLFELQAGFNDLPRPAGAPEGTRFHVGFEFDRRATEQSVVLSDFTIVFYLADSLHGDLN